MRREALAQAVQCIKHSRTLCQVAPQAAKAAPQWELPPQPIQQPNDPPKPPKPAMGPQVPAEIAFFLAKRHVGLVDMPSEVKETLDKYILGSGLRGRKLRMFGRRLTDHLKKISRTEARGGIMGWLELESRKSRQRKKRELQNAVEAFYKSLKEPTSVVGALPSSSTLDNAENDGTAKGSKSKGLAVQIPTGQQLKVPWSTSGFVTAHKDKPDFIQETPTPSYEEITTGAYAATRMPACYAAIVRVLDELKTRLPSFKPKKMLDFGSGPGTAIWAAQEVWPDCPTHILAVEPSWPMVALGQEVEASRQKAGLLKDTTIRWVSKLPALKGSFLNQQRRYDMVTASYVLSEIPAADERQRMIRHLWERCGDVLVLVEPGTPVGAANIQEARTLLLEMERKKYAKQINALPKSLIKDSVICLDELDPLSRHRIESLGCHIIAPCPHDGACPMAGKKMWCHFSQRFLRTRAMKVTKIRPENKHGPRDFQDERFSYIVFRRGWRDRTWGSHVEAVRVSKDFWQDIKPDEPGEYTPMKYKKYDTEDEDVEEPDVEDPLLEFYKRADLTDLSPETRKLMLRSILGDEEDEDVDDLNDSNDESDSEIDSENAQTPTEENPDDLEAIIQRLQKKGVKAMVNPDDQINQGDSKIGSASKDTNIPEGAVLIQGRNIGIVPSMSALMKSKEVVEEKVEGEVLTSKRLPDSLSEIRIMDWDDLAPEAISKTRAAASRWSRIIRRPRKRTGHTIIDVCTACGPETDTEASSGTTQGKLQRHIVARSDKKRFMGRAGYRIAMKMKWGDLWPTHYNANRKVWDL